MGVLTRQDESFTVEGLKYLELQIETTGSAAVNIDWGDGNVEAYTPGGANANHTYAANYTGEISIQAVDGDYSTAITTVIVRNAQEGTVHNVPSTTTEYRYPFTVGSATNIKMSAFPDSMEVIEIFAVAGPELTGDIADLPSTVTRLISANTSLKGDIAALAGLSTLDFLMLQGTTTIEGDVAALTNKSSLANITIEGENRLSGDLSGLFIGNTSLTSVKVNGANAITGSITTVPAGLAELTIGGNNRIAGDLASIPNVTRLEITGDNDLTYSSGGAITASQYIEISTNRPVPTMTQANVDQLIADVLAGVAAAGGTRNGGTLIIDGNYPSPSNAGNANVATLMSTHGWTVVTTYKEQFTFTVASDGTSKLTIQAPGLIKVDWGDGSAVETLANGVQAQHTYSAATGPYSASVIANGATAITATSSRISSIDVSSMTSVSVLNVVSNQLTALDVTNNTALTLLYCHTNQLTALDVTNNTALTQLQCNNNQLTALDVSNNTALATLWCHVNQLTALSVTNNTTLTQLWCYTNQLTALDVSANTALTDFRCQSNQLAALDVSNNTALTTLYCNTNQLTALDVSANTALTLLYCNANQLTAAAVDSVLVAVRDNNTATGARVMQYDSQPASAHFDANRTPATLWSDVAALGWTRTGTYA